jgi:hypothetical protein
MPAHARRPRALAPTLAAPVLLMALLLCALLLSGCTASTASGASAATAASASATAAPCGRGAIPVGTTPRALQRALDSANPGDVLQLADTTYEGAFVITRSGTSADPVTLCGTAASVLSGGGAGADATALRLAGAAHWLLRDFAVTASRTGIVLDGASHNELRELDVSDTGSEGIRVRGGSAYVTIAEVTVRDTGVVDREDGQGIAIGSAESTWCRYSGCEPDRSDFALIVRNSIDHTAGEAISAEEGTSSGVIRDNRLSRGDGTSADAVVDLKGNDWIFARNEVGDAAGPGVQVHSFLPEWGLGNRIRDNTFGGSPDEIAVEVLGTAALAATRVGCDNTMTWGPRARTNVTCS